MVVCRRPDSESVFKERSFPGRIFGTWAALRRGRPPRPAVARSGNSFLDGVLSVSQKNRDFIQGGDPTPGWAWSLPADMYTSALRGSLLESVRKHLWNLAAREKRAYAADLSS